MADVGGEALARRLGGIAALHRIAADLVHRFRKRFDIVRRLHINTCRIQQRFYRAHAAVRAGQLAVLRRQLVIFLSQRLYLLI